MLNFWVPNVSGSKRGVFFGFACSLQAFCVLVGQKGLRMTKLWSFSWTPVHYLAVHERTPFSRDGFRRVVSKLSVLYTKVLFPHIDCSIPRIPSCSWLSGTYFTACHRAKQGEIRRIVAKFSWIYIQMGLARSSSMYRKQRFSLLSRLMFVLTIIFWISFQRKCQWAQNLVIKYH